MADNKDNWTTKLNTSGGFGGLNQSLNDGLMYDGDGKPVVPEIVVPKGAEIVQSGMVGAFRRTVFSDGSVETVQTLPAVPSDGKIVTPVPLPGEQQDVTGTGQDADTKPKLMGKSSK